MPVPLNFLKDPWADTGDRAQFPYNPDTITELMSWLKGFTAKYQRIPEEGGVYIERREFNQILYLLTKQIIDAFKITASDAQLDAEITDRIQKDNNLQHQIDTKIIKVEPLSVSFGVTYTAQHSGIIAVDIEWGNPGDFQSPGCEYMNAELICSSGSNSQFCFPIPYAWKQSTTVPAGARGGMSLRALVEEGDTYQLKGETIYGFDGASRMRVDHANILYLGG